MARLTKPKIARKRSKAFPAGDRRAPIVRFRDVSIVFGAKPHAALPLVDEKRSRREIEEACGQVLGVADCTLDIGEGEIVVLMGLSGSGKSTLLRAVNGLNPVVRGHVEVRMGDGTWVNPHAVSARRLRELRQRRVAMVFQAFGLLPWRTVRANVAFGMEIAGASRAEQRRKVDEQLALVGLDGWGERRVAELSGGMQQRVGLARAFATDAPILLMDEPFSALDPLIRSKLQDDLLELQARLKRTIIFVSHDLDEALKLGNRIAIMEGGRIVQTGTARHIVSAPETDYVAEFVGSIDRQGVLTVRDVMTAETAPFERPRPREAVHLATSGVLDREGRELRSTVFVIVAPDTDLQRAIAALNRSGLPLLVEEDGRIVGTVTAEDVVRALER